MQSRQTYSVLGKIAILLSLLFLLRQNKCCFDDILNRCILLGYIKEFSLPAKTAFDLSQGWKRNGFISVLISYWRDSWCAWSAIQANLLFCKSHFLFQYFRMMKVGISWIDSELPHCCRPWQLTEYITVYRWHTAINFISKVILNIHWCKPDSGNR